MILIGRLLTPKSVVFARVSPALQPQMARTWTLPQRARAEKTKIRDDHFAMTQGNSRALVHVLPRGGNR